MQHRLRTAIGAALAAVVMASGGFCAYNYPKGLDGPPAADGDRPTNLLPAPVEPDGLN